MDSRGHKERKGPGLIPMEQIYVLVKIKKRKKKLYHKRSNQKTKNIKFEHIATTISFIFIFISFMFNIFIFKT